MQKLPEVVGSGVATFKQETITGNIGVWLMNELVSLFP
jgi:hypothetical protein